MIDMGPSKAQLYSVWVKQAGHGQVGSEARALGLGRAWLVGIVTVPYSTAYGYGYGHVVPVPYDPR